MKAFGKYQLLDEIGKSPAGTVYRASDALSGRDLAVKVLDSAAANPELKTRFYAELAACSELQHPNIVKILDIGEVEGAIYIATELLQGADLSRYFLGNRKLSLVRKLRLIAQVYDGLALAHSRKIVHGDIKPANIFLTDQGDARILDFGISKLPNYLAPADVVGDLFSLATVLYQLVAGVPAFPLGSTAEPQRLRKIDPQVPEELDRLVLTALARDPQQRPQTAEIMTARLCAIAEQLPQELPAPAPLAASATAAAGAALAAIQTPEPPKPAMAVSNPEATASAAPQPAREQISKSERGASEVTRIDPTVPLPAPTRAVPPEAAVEPVAVVSKRSPLRRGVLFAAAAALGLFIVAGLLSRQASNANQRGAAGIAAPSGNEVPPPAPPAPALPAVADTPQTEHPADRILNDQIDALWESGQYSQAMQLVDAILASEPGNSEALAWQKKIHAAQEAEAALR
jgi:hypothetical protein